MIDSAPSAPEARSPQTPQTPKAPGFTRATARPAGMRKRHKLLLMSFLIGILGPLVLVAFYLWVIAEDQYASVTGFAVRKEEGGAISETLGGLIQFAGGSVSSESDILYEFIRSSEIVAAVDRKIDLRSHYAQYWPGDWAFSIWPDATIEDLTWFWQRVVRISYDKASGLIEVTVLAFDPQTAQIIAQAILDESQNKINTLNAQAREDAMRYALSDLEVAVARLKEAREAMTNFRTRTQIVDPEADFQGRMGVMNTLQQQLAQSLIEFDLLAETTKSTDPRIAQAQRRIEVIRQRIAQERRSFASQVGENGAAGDDFPKLFAEYEGLVVDREYAEETYRSALSALDLARANAARQSRYLASYIRPSLPESSEYPRRAVLFWLTALVLALGWATLALIYYSIRDRG
ncbi:sugar transporter [Pseudothioclava arenosa]|nr:sugar transporter [Pseudothioclava arenosa]